MEEREESANIADNVDNQTKNTSSNTLYTFPPGQFAHKSDLS